MSPGVMILGWSKTLCMIIKLIFTKLEAKVYIVKISNI